MLDTAIPRKTVLGQREISERQHKLHARSRSLLIAVNGEQPLAELRRQFAALGDVPGILAELQSLGLVSIAAGAAPVAPLPDLPPLQLARAFINETAVAALGLRAFLFTLKLERCYTQEELSGLLPEYQRVLAKVKDEDFAKAMVARVRQILAQA